MNDCPVCGGNVEGDEPCFPYCGPLCEDEDADTAYERSIFADLMDKGIPTDMY